MAAMAAGEARMKTGLWTQHIDSASGRKYYFNMVHNRSYWELPDELLGEVKAPMIETLREWDPEAAARYEQPQQAMTEKEQLQRRRREELLRAAHASESTYGATPGNMGALEERMALAAQKRTDSLAAQQQKPKEEESSAVDNANNGYLKMVRELQAKDRDTEDSGGKWLVR